VEVKWYYRTVELKHPELIARILWLGCAHTPFHLATLSLDELHELLSMHEKSRH